MQCKKIRQVTSVILTDFCFNYYYKVHNVKKRPHFSGDKCGLFAGAGGGGRTRTVSLPTDFESASSANSNTPAFAKAII